MNAKKYGFWLGDHWDDFGIIEWDAKSLIKDDTGPFNSFEKAKKALITALEERIDDYQSSIDMAKKLTKKNVE